MNEAEKFNLIKPRKKTTNTIEKIDYSDISLDGATETNYKRLNASLVFNISQTGDKDLPNASLVFNISQTGDKDLIKDVSEIASNVSATKKNIDEIVSNANKEIKDIKKEIQTLKADNSEDDKQKKIDRLVQIIKSNSENVFRKF